MKPAAEPTPGQTRDHLDILKSIAAGKSPAGLAASYPPKITDAFRTQLRDNLARTKSFVFLGREIFTPDHFMLDATAAQVFRYKMTLPDKAVYYHVRLNKQNEISWISSEE